MCKVSVLVHLRGKTPHLKDADTTRFSGYDQSQWHAGKTFKNEQVVLKIGRKSNHLKANVPISVQVTAHSWPNRRNEDEKIKNNLLIDLPLCGPVSMRYWRWETIGSPRENEPLFLAGRR
jgi:hypothetical protein